MAGAPRPGDGDKAGATLRVDPALKYELKVEAAKRSLTLRALTEYLLRTGLNRRPTSKKEAS